MPHVLSQLGQTIEEVAAQQAAAFLADFNKSLGILQSLLLRTQHLVFAWLKLRLTDFTDLEFQEILFLVPFPAPGA